MTYWDKTNWNCYLEQVEDLLETPAVRAMQGIRHHPGVSCYEHSVFVSYTAFRLARKWRLDYRAAARAGLLHDLYLYDPRSLRSYRQCFAHPAAALRNAVKLCGGLSSKEENILLSHMWPMARRRPRCREALTVNLADKLCATAEVTHIWRRLALRRILLA